MRFWPRKSHTCTYVRNEWIKTILVVTAEHVRKVEENITMEVSHVPFLLVVTVRILATFCIQVISTRSSSLSLKTVVCNTQSDTRSKPFTYGNIKCRSNAFSEIRFTVVVAKVHLTTNATTNEPIGPKTISLYSVGFTFCFSFFLSRQAHRSPYH